MSGILYKIQPLQKSELYNQLRIKSESGPLVPSTSSGCPSVPTMRELFVVMIVVVSVVVVADYN